jgi:hypothetical protein
VIVCEFTRPCQGVDDRSHDNRRHSVLQHESGQLAAAGHSGANVQVSRALRRRTRSTSYAWLYRRALHEDGGATFAPGTGYDGGCAQGVFSVGLQGVGEEDVPLRLATIDQVLARSFVVGSVTYSVKVLHEVAEKGFEQEQLMAIMHQVTCRVTCHPHLIPHTLRAIRIPSAQLMFQVELDGLAVSADRGLRLALDVRRLCTLT